MTNANCLARFFRVSRLSATKYAVYFEFAILSVSIIALLWLHFSDFASLSFPAWLTSWLTFFILWLIPGFLLWYLIDSPKSYPWFYALPLSSSFGLAWLFFLAVPTFVFNGDLTQYLRLTTILTLLLNLAYIFFRLYRQRPSPIKPSPTHNNLIVMGAALFMGILLFIIFFNTVGYSANDDQWGSMFTTRYLLDAATISEFLPWNLFIALLVQASGVEMIPIYFFYLPPLLMLIAGFSYLTFADTLFKNHNIGYFAFIIHAIYLLSDINFFEHFNSSGTAFFTRLTEDKFAVLLLIFPLVQAFFIKFLRSGQQRYLIYCGLNIVLALAIHLISITWIAFSIGGLAPFVLLFRRTRPVIFFYASSLILFTGASIFAWIIRSSQPDSLFNLADPTNVQFIAWFEVGGYLQIQSYEPIRYLLPWSLLNHPLEILFILATVSLLFVIKKSLTAQFLFSNTVIPILLLFNPITATWIGQLTSPWMLHRIIWMLPVSLTLGYVFFTFVQKFQLLLARYNFIWVNHNLVQDSMVLIIPIGLVIWLNGPMLASWRSLTVVNGGSVITSQEQDLMAYIQTMPNPGRVLASLFINRHHLLAFTSNVGPIPYSWGHPQHPESVADRDYFFQEAQTVDQSIVNILNKYAVDHIIVERDIPLASYLQWMPGLFHPLYTNNEYILYAWRPKASTATELFIIEGNTHLRAANFTLAEQAFQQALAIEPISPLAILGLGTIYETELNFDQAVNLYQNALQMSPDNPWFHLRLANNLFQASKGLNPDINHQVLTHYHQALTLQPTDKNLHAQVLAEFTGLPSDLKDTPQGQVITQQLTKFFEDWANARPDLFQRQKTLATTYERLQADDQALTLYQTLTQKFPGRVDPYLEMARIYEQQSDIPQAIQTLQTAIQHRANPESITPYLRLSTLYRQLGAYEQALNYAQQALAVPQSGNNDYVVGQIKLEQGLVYQAQNEFILAEQQFLAALPLLNTEAQVYAIIGDFYRQQDKFSEAIAYYRQAVALQPQSPRYHQTLGELLLEGKNTFEGVHTLVKSRFLLPTLSHEIYAHLGMFIWKFPNLAVNPMLEQYQQANIRPDVAYLGLARLQREQENYTQALTFAEQAVQVSQDNRIKARALFEQGYSYAAKGDNEKALERIQTALNIPGSNELYQNVGELAFRYEQFELAHTSLEEAIRFAPKNIQAYLRLAKVLSRLGREPEAEQIYNAALSLAAEDPHLYQKMGDFFGKRQEWDQAIEFYELAIKQDFSGIDLFTNLGDAYQALGHNDEALFNYQQAVQAVANLEAQGLPVLVNQLQLADRLWSNGDQPGAVAVWHRVLQVAPDNLYVNWRLSQFYLQEDEADQAASYQTKIRQFSRESIQPSPNHYLNQYQAQAFLKAVQEKLWPEETLFEILSHHLRYTPAPITTDLIQSLLQEQPENIDLLLTLGELYYQQQAFPQAQDTYKQVLELDAKTPLATLRLADLIEASCQQSSENCPDLEQAVKLYERYLTLSPNDLLGLKKLMAISRHLNQEEADHWQKLWIEQAIQQGPTVFLNQTLESGWTLIGYQQNSQVFIPAVEPPLWLYWQAPPDTTIPENEMADWYTLGGRQWVQVIENPINLVKNNGFELGLSAGLPPEFEDLSGGASEATHKLTLNKRDGHETTVALLQNSDSISDTNYVSTPILIDERAIYLQTGWVSSRQGYASLGHIFNGDIPAGESGYTYIASGITSAEWHHFAQLIQPPPQATSLRIWLRNASMGGQAAFDDLKLFKIEAPASINE